MGKNYLITSNLENKWVEKKRRVYLGDWTYDLADLNKKTNKLNKNSFNLENDIKYLENLLNRLSSSLSVYFNRYHKVKFKKYFWQNLIWIWLSYYIASNYYRWKKIIRISNKNKFIYLNLDIKKNIYSDNVGTYENLVSGSDLFNYLSIKKIIVYLKDRFIFKNYKHKNTYNDFIFLKNKNSITNKILSLISLLFSPITANNKIFISTGFSFKNLLKLNLGLGQFPTIFSTYFKKNYCFKITEKKIDRNQNFFKFHTKNSFEKFIESNILDEIPLNYLEKFFFNFEKIKKINLNPKVIISAGEHLHNDNFKLWLLYKKFFLKSKIIVIDHGGNHHLNTGQFDYDFKIGDQVIGWDKKYNKHKLPNPILYKNFLSRVKNETLIYVGSEISKFPYRVGPHEKGLSEIKSYKNLKILRKNLKKEIYKKLYYAPKKIKDDRLKSVLIRVVGKKKILKNGSFKHHLRKSKIVICDYPQTAFLESLISGPTFLLCDYKKFWKPRRHFLNIYKLLEKNNILFRDIDSLTNFINKNWNNIDEWWNKKNVKKTRDKFLDKFSINYLDNLLYSWKQFLLKYK